MFWIIEFTDGAILGLVRGSRSQRTIDGPFESYEAAMDAKQSYTRYGCTYYGIRESESRPADTKNDYEFVDAASEFEDVGGW